MGKNNKKSVNVPQAAVPQGITLATTKLKEENLGIFAMTAEERSDLGKRNYNQGIGCFSLTPEKRSEVSRKVAYQKWMCLETGFITNAGNLTKYQKARGIDTSKRVKIS